MCAFVIVNTWSDNCVRAVAPMFDFWLNVLDTAVFMGQTKASHIYFNIEASGVRISLLTTMIYQAITKIARKTFIY